MFKDSSSKKVLITGATGSIGQYLVPIFLKNKYEIQATTRDLKNAEQFSWSNDVEFIKFDMNDALDDLDIYPETGIVHLAWQGLPNYQSDFHIEENLPINYNFVKSLIERGAKHILIAGTCAEYGMRQGMIKASDPTEPNTQYAIAKDTLHKQLRFLQQSHDFALQWARLFYVYDGDGQRSNSLIKQLDKAIDNKEKTFNMTGGEQLRDYLPIEEVVEQLYFLFENFQDGTFNICSGIPIRLKRLVEDHIKKRNSKIKINAGFYPYHDYEPMEFWGEKDIRLK